MLDDVVEDSRVMDIEMIYLTMRIEEMHRTWGPRNLTLALLQQLPQVGGPEAGDT